MGNDWVSLRMIQEPAVRRGTYARFMRGRFAGIVRHLWMRSRTSNRRDWMEIPGAVEAKSKSPLVRFQLFVEDHQMRVKALEDMQRLKSRGKNGHTSWGREAGTHQANTAGFHPHVYSDIFDSLP